MADDENAPDCDARCVCGSLLARLTAQGVELKCRRCKRVVVLPLTAARRPGTPRPPPGTPRK